MSETGLPSQGASPAVTRPERPSGRAWLTAAQDRIRNPSLTVILILEFGLIFVSAPLATLGLPIAESVFYASAWIMVLVVVALSHRPGALAVIVAGLVLAFADFSWFAPSSSNVLNAVNRGGNILVFGALTWVVAHSVFAPGRITSQRLQGAVVVYLNIAICFAFAYCLLLELSPTAFVNVQRVDDGRVEFATMLYFSLTTLTTTGFGDIPPVHPIARSLANLEAVLGLFYIAITIARLVTLQREREESR